MKYRACTNEWFAARIPASTVFLVAIAPVESDQPDIPFFRRLESLGNAGSAQRRRKTRRIDARVSLNSSTGIEDGGLSIKSPRCTSARWSRRRVNATRFIKIEASRTEERVRKEINIAGFVTREYPRDIVYLPPCSRADIPIDSRRRREGFEVQNPRGAPFSRVSRITDVLAKNRSSPFVDVFLSSPKRSRVNARSTIG